MANASVKLGLMPPLTGLVNIYGTEIVRAAQIACAEVNEAGGVLGRKLELVIEDDGSLPTSAVAAAKRLIDELGCVAIVGNLLSNSRIAVAYSVAEPRKIPYLNFSFYEGSILSRYFFHFAALPNQQIDRMIPYMRQRFGGRMFFAGNNYEWPRGSIAAAKQALVKSNGAPAGEVVGEAYLPIGVNADDIERLLDQVEAAAPDVLVPCFAGADQIELLTRFTHRGLKPGLPVVMGHYDEMMASALAPKVREGLFSSNTYFMSVDTAENRRYLSRLATWPGVTGIWPAGNGILTNFGEGAYLCVKAFAQAAQAAGCVDPEALVDALQGITVTGPQGVVRMDPVTHHATVNTYLSRCEANGSFTIVETFGAIAPVLPQRYNHQRVDDRATLEGDIRLQARMLEQMSEAVLLIDASDAGIVYANAAVSRLFGYGSTELIGASMALLDAASQDRSAPTYVEIVRLLPAKGGWQGELQNRRRDGSVIWCSVSLSAFTHPVHGELWLCVAGDITERRASAARLNDAQRLAKVGSWELDVRRGELIWSDEVFRLFEIDKSQFIATYEVFLDAIHPDDRDQVNLAYEKSLQERKPYDITHRLRMRDGRIKWVHERCQIDFDEKGRPLRSMGTIQDITAQRETEHALRESEQRYQSMVASLAEGVVLRGKDGGVIAANDAALRILGMSRDQLIGRTSADLGWQAIHEDGSAFTGETHPGAVTFHTGEAQSNVVMGVAAADGHVTWLSVNSQPILRPGESSPSAVVVSFVDISERKRAESELRGLNDALERRVELRTAELVHARDEADRANAAKTEFLSRMSHELRTPLNAVIGFAQLLETDPEHPLTATQIDNVQEIRYAGDHLLKLINEVLDLSRIESGRLELCIEAVAVVPLLQASLKQLQLLAAQREVSMTLKPGAPLTAHADATRFKQVVLNLLSNAIKYNRPGGSVEVSCAPADPQRLRVLVRDTGHGIAASALPRLFLPFERFGSPDDNIEGSGIGLPLAKHLVEAMGGHIGVHSVLGEGSTFWFDLPLTPPSESNTTLKGDGHAD